MATAAEGVRVTRREGRWSGRCWSATGTVLVGLLVAASWVVAAPAGAAAAPPVVGCDQAANVVTVTHSVDLDPTCTYSGGLVVTRSHLTLDCRGARIDQGDGRSGVGIIITSPASVALTDITVRNCVVHGFGNGLLVTRPGVKAVAAGHEYDHDDSRIRIVHDQISGTGGVASSTPT